MASSDWRLMPLPLLSSAWLGRGSDDTHKLLDLLRPLSGQGKAAA